MMSQFRFRLQRTKSLKSNLLASFRHLTIFTSEQELFVPTTENKALNTYTIAVKKQTSYGSGEVNPVEFDGAMMFLTKSRVL